MTLEIRQAGGHDPVASSSRPIAEVLEAHTITGAGDMLCRVVARTNADLQRVIDAIVDVPGVLRTSTVIALATPVGYRSLPLVRAADGELSCRRPAAARRRARLMLGCERSRAMARSRSARSVTWSAKDIQPR